MDSKELSLTQLSGAILAGGAGRRMNRKDKGLLDYRGRPLISHAIDLLTPHVSQIIISANRNLDRYAQFGYPIIQDQISGHQGPLAGIAACLASIQTDFLLVLPCDSPDLPYTLVPRLCKGMDEGSKICFAATPKQNYPIIALLRRETLTSLTEFMASGERKVLTWYQQQSAKRILFEDDEPFINLNTPESLLQNEES